MVELGPADVGGEAHRVVDLLEQERGVPVEVPRGGRLDWSPLRAKIAAQGMRNSNVLATAITVKDVIAAEQRSFPAGAGIVMAKEAVDYALTH